MLTKTPKVGDEVFITERGFHNKVELRGTSTVDKVGRSYLHVKVYGRTHKFTFRGHCPSYDCYTLWDSLESYKEISERRNRRSDKITQIQSIVSDYRFGEKLREEALDEILQLITPKVH